MHVPVNTENLSSISRVTFEFVRSRLEMSAYHKVHCLSLAAPDALNEAITLSETVEGIVALTHGTDETAEGVDVVLALNSATVLVNLGDGDLDRSVVLGLDDAVGGAALAGDVATIRIQLAIDRNLRLSHIRRLGLVF